MKIKLNVGATCRAHSVARTNQNRYFVYRSKESLVGKRAAGDSFFIL